MTWSDSGVNSFAQVAVLRVVCGGRGGTAVITPGRLTRVSGAHNGVQQWMRSGYISKRATELVHGLDVRREREGKESGDCKVWGMSHFQSTA